MKFFRKENLIMGFSMPDDYHHIRINLSENAYMVMHDDMLQFNIKNRSTFVNTIFHNFMNDSKASIDCQLDNKERELYEIINSNNLGENNKLLIQALLANEESKLVNTISKLKSKKYKSQIYYLNEDNYKAFKERSDFRYSCYKTLSQYLKCILEDYASLSYLEREKNFFHEQYLIAEQAIINEILLEVTTQNNHTFRIYPYSLDTDALSTRLYLTGMSKPKHISNTTKEKYPASFRIPRLKKIKLVQTRKNGELVGRNGKLTKNEKLEIKSAISTRKIQFLVGNEEKICIRLTTQGIEMYKSLLYMRPQFDPKESTDHEFVFYCTEYQAEFYFFKFGKEVEILSPNSLREKFKKAYKEASIVYENADSQL